MLDHLVRLVCVHEPACLNVFPDAALSCDPVLLYKVGAYADALRTAKVLEVEPIESDDCLCDNAEAVVVPSEICDLGNKALCVCKALRSKSV